MAKNIKAWNSIEKNLWKYTSYKALAKDLKKAKPTFIDAFHTLDRLSKHTKYLKLKARHIISNAGSEYHYGDMLDTIDVQKGDSKSLAEAMGRAIGEVITGVADRKLMVNTFRKGMDGGDPRPLLRSSKRDIKEDMVALTFSLLDARDLKDLNLHEEVNAEAFRVGLVEGTFTYWAGDRIVDHLGKPSMNKLLTRLVNDIRRETPDPHADKSEEELAALGLVKVEGFVRADGTQVKTHYRKIN